MGFRLFIATKTALVRVHFKNNNKTRTRTTRNRIFNRDPQIYPSCCLAFERDAPEILPRNIFIRRQNRKTPSNMAQVFTRRKPIKL